MPPRHWIAAALLAAAGVARADGDPPQRHYQLKPTYSRPQVCLDVLPDHKLRLSHQDETLRDPIVLDGSYQVTSARAGAFKLRFTVEQIHHKTLSRCREHWIDEALDATTMLETAIKRGDQLTLTLDHRCVAGRATVKLCFLAAGPDRKQTVCRELADHDKPGC